MSEPRRRTACYVVRNGPAGQELLVFDHIDLPKSGTQVPAGGVEPGETIAAAAVREVQEEAGLTDVSYDGLRFACRFAPLPLDGVVLADDQGVFLHSIPKAPDPRP